MNIRVISKGTVAIVKVGNNINSIPDADQVPISDAGGYYTSGNVEGALQENGATDASQQTSIDTNTSAIATNTGNISTNTANISANTSAIATKVDTAGRALNKSGTTLNVDDDFNSTQYNSTYQTLTIGSGNLVSWDMSQGQAAKLTLTSDATISNPTNKYSICPILEVTQDATGGHTLSFDTDFVEVNTDNVTEDANSVTVYAFVKDSSGNFRGRGQTFAS